MSITPALSAVKEPRETADSSVAALPLSSAFSNAPPYRMSAAKDLSTLLIHMPCYRHSRPEPGKSGVLPPSRIPVKRLCDRMLCQNASWQARWAAGVCFAKKDSRYARRAGQWTIEEGRSYSKVRNSYVSFQIPPYAWRRRLPLRRSAVCRTGKRKSSMTKVGRYERMQRMMTRQIMIEALARLPILVALMLLQESFLQPNICSPAGRNFLSFCRRPRLYRTALTSPTGRRAQINALVRNTRYITTWARPPMPTVPMANQ